MSAQSATSCLDPSLEGLGNRINPSLLSRFGAPTSRAARFGSALPLPLNAGGHGHSRSPIAFDGIVQADPAPTKSVGEALIAGCHDLVTTGANGSLCAVAKPNYAYPGCPPGGAR